MSIADRVAPHIPYLRRFARMLTGDQTGGDAYVAATLESLISRPDQFSTDLHARAALYKVFLKVWSSVSANKLAEDDLSNTLGCTARRIAALTPVARQAFLLVTVENFTMREAAEILDRTERQLKSDLAQAAREICEQVATGILIIEDEPLVAMDLEAAVESLGHIVLSVARTYTEAVDTFADLKPGLILADLRLADDSSGLDAVNEILLSYEVPVIFITAYPEQALTGLRPEPTFLIAKPFKHDLLKAVVSQALFFDVKAGRQQGAASA